MLNREFLITIIARDREDFDNEISLHKTITGYDYMKHEIKREVICRSLCDMFLMVDRSSAELMTYDVEDEDNG